MKQLIYQWLNRRAEWHARDRATFWLVKLESEPSPKVREDFDRWLERDPRNQRAYLYITALTNAASRSPALHTMPAPAKPWFGMPQWLTISAPLAACLVLAVVFMFPQASGDLYQSSEQRIYITLADGSDLTLQPNSEVIAHYNQETRLIKLEHGEAFFDVKADANRPFIVATPNGQVTVLGTQFSVSALQGDNTAIGGQVTVIEGKVKVENREQQSLQLIADQSISLAATGAAFQVKPTNAREKLAWRKEQFVFRQQQLSQVIGILNDHFGRQIELDNDALGGLSVDAVLRADDFQFALDMISQSLSLSVTLEPNGIIRLSQQ